MKIIYLFLLVGISRLSVAQSLEQFVIGTSGTDFSSSNAQLSWTIGETVINTLLTGNQQLTQGFHQTTLQVSSVDKNEDTGFSALVFPNPSVETIVIQIENETEEFQYSISDILGRVLHQENILNNRYTTVDLSNFLTGNYLLKISSKDKKSIRTFKIQKLQ